MMVFGANASGKSNLLNAIDSLARYVQSSSQYKGGKPIPVYQPFGLTLEKPKPTSFEVEFIATDSLRYLYQLSYTESIVVEEELYVYSGLDKKRKNLLFQRNSMGDLKFGELYRGPKGFNIYDNQLILSQAGISPNPTILPAYQFFESSLYCYTFHDTNMDDNLLVYLKEDLNARTDHEQFIENLNKLLRAADTSIEGIEVKGELDTTVRNLYNGRKLLVLQEQRIKTVHRIYDGDDNIIGLKEFDLVDESTGTQKLLLVGSLVLRALEHGQLIVVDELDKSLHPHLTKMIISLFNDPVINIHGAQLFMATHDATVMDQELFRLDQILIADKELNGNSKYTKLSDFTGISKVPNLDDWYLLGAFGGVPMINEFELDLKITDAA
jgi:predicted ATPase